MGEHFNNKSVRQEQEVNSYNVVVEVNRRKKKMQEKNTIRNYLQPRR